MESFVFYLILLITAPLIPGLINEVKAFWAGRTGPPLLQPYYELIRLLKKSQVISDATTPVFRLAPAVTLAGVLCAAMFVPVAGQQAFLSFDGDFILFAYLLALARAFTIFSAMDTASSFEGMGASREATFSALMEPAFFIIFAALAILTGFKSFSQVPLIIPPPVAVTAGSSLLDNIIWVEKIWWRTGILIPGVSGALVLGFLILVENSRMPVDDPDTHLELTMIHEVMVLDNSGPDLAMIQYGSALKMAMLTTLISVMFIPGWLPVWLGCCIYFLILALVAVVVGTIESVMARLRMTHVPQFIFGAVSVALLVIFVIEIVRLGNLI
ncbi:MAG TPA: NADH-quinone oxidoreductase subunit H [Thermodesulfovibrionia bacterium]|nr:NADH-quinone oxidoreductase subunit H [Thermodesulfovibrionia bacterium]